MRTTSAPRQATWKCGQCGAALPFVRWIGDGGALCQRCVRRAIQARLWDGDADQPGEETDG
jgi:ribosomal protein L34E